MLRSPQVGRVVSNDEMDEEEEVEEWIDDKKKMNNEARNILVLVVPVNVGERGNGFVDVDTR